MNGKKTVTIPSMPEHRGVYKITIDLDWVCPMCGSPRGEVVKKRSWDGSLYMEVDGWDNPCGHIDYYHKVRLEASGVNQ